MAICARYSPTSNNQSTEGLRNIDCESEKRRRSRFDYFDDYFIKSKTRNPFIYADSEHCETKVRTMLTTHIVSLIFT